MEEILQTFNEIKMKSFNVNKSCNIGDVIFIHQMFIGIIRI